MPIDHSLRLMTYNIGGGRKNYRSVQKEIVELIQKIGPDVLALQESTELIDSEDEKISVPELIAGMAGFGKNYYYGETLSMQANMQVKNTIMVQGIYQDWKNWSQGNAILSRQGFTRLSDPGKEGTPRNIPLYRPPVYEGTRDTDPRYAILTRIKYAPIFPYLVCTHLTTLLGEREKGLAGHTRETRTIDLKNRELPGKSTEAQVLRYQQMKILLDIVRPAMERNEVVILMGDLNAEIEEACISSVLLSHRPSFIRLEPENTQARTHPKADSPIDHIFVFPADRLVSYKCWIEDKGIARNASDHFPVIADIALK